jgi:hypothetical protein
MKFIIFAVAALSFIVGLFLGDIIVKQSFHCPEVHAGIETTFITTIIHDTIRTEKTRKEIQVSRIIDMVLIKDSSDTSKLLPKEDTSTCYSFDSHEKDGAYIKADICSDSFTIIKPLDLKATIFYQAAPDTLRKIFRVDTLVKTQKLDWRRDWKTYALVLTSIAFAGYAIGKR